MHVRRHVTRQLNNLLAKVMGNFRCMSGKSNSTVNHSSLSITNLFAKLLREPDLPILHSFSDEGLERCDEDGLIRVDRREKVTATVGTAA